MIYPPIVGATTSYARFIQTNIQALVAKGPWYVAAAKVARVVVTPDPGVREQIAEYEHGSRDLKVSLGVGELMFRAMAHEFAHGFDDDGVNLHRFSMTGEWLVAWKSQTNFEIPKYGKDPKEHFADMCSKALIQGVRKLGYAYPTEAQYINRVVFPTLVSEYATR